MNLKFPLVLLIIFSCYLEISSQNKSLVIENVKILDLSTATLTKSKNILITDGIISKIDDNKIIVKTGITVINGRGKTLIPGLIDAHVHMFFGALTMSQLAATDFSENTMMQNVAASSERMLMRGFTSVRDAGGPIFPLKNAIDKGNVIGPRIWPSGATISQTGGHGDFRTPDERSRRFFGKASRAEQLGATFIADGRDDVLTATRENLRFGASQIKIMAGGGTSSAYDPIDVTQYTFDEIKAAVDAADDWGTYVMVHAYTPKAVKRAVEAGVRCIEHGQLLDEPTLKLLADKGVWLSLQNLMDNNDNMDEGRKLKRKDLLIGQDLVWPLAKRLGVKLAWGTDFLFEPELNNQQNDYILRLRDWFTNAEILKMLTEDNGELLQMSGSRSPYPGKLGVIKEGALADVILVDGNPLKDITLLASPEARFLVIIKDGIVFKNILKAKN